MAFLKELRRRSRASFRANSSSGPPAQSGSDATVGTAGKSASATDSSSHSSNNTPPPSLKPSQSSSHLPFTSRSDSWLSPPPQRPVPITSQSNRNSVVGLNSIVANGSPKNHASTSPFAPRVVSISDNSWVHQKVLLIYGQSGEAQHNALDGTVSITHTQDAFPSIAWPVRGSYFKALVHLVPGPNRIRLDFTSPKVPRATPHTSWISINYLPLVNSPPLQLAILLGKDSDGQFDTPSNKQSGLEIAIRKFRMAAYLWQAFSGEQMYRNNFGRRCFRFEEGWQTGSLSLRELETGQMRNEAKVHVVRCDKTVEELKALSTTSSSQTELFSIAREALGKYFDLRPGQQQHIALLLLDSHWDNVHQAVTSNEAMKSDQDDIKLAVFGSQGLHGYPSCLEEVVSSFSDCARVETNSVANKNNNGVSSSWEAASSNIGHHLHEVGHLFGCLDHEAGIMGQDYLRINRTFMTWEPYSIKTKEQGLRLCLQHDECGWHRLDALRFRFHPCFRLPSDAPSPQDSIYVWPVESGKVMVNSASGIAFIEMFVDEDSISNSFIEYVNAEAGNCSIPKQISFTENEIRSRLPEGKRKAKKLKLAIYSGGLHRLIIEDISELKPKHSTVKLPNGKTGYRNYMNGSFRHPNDVVKDLLLECSFIQTKLLTSIKVYYEIAVSGIEFCYEDSTTQILGTQNGHHDEFVLDTRRGEILMGFNLGAGHKVEAIEILTSSGRKSPVFGNITCRTGCTLITPRGYKVAGVSGSVGNCISGLSLIITR